MIVHRHNYRRTAVVLGVSAAILYCLWFLGYLFNPSAMANLDVSALQTQGQPHYGFFVVGDIATGAVIFLLVFCLIKLFHRTKVHRRVSFWLCMLGLLAFGLMTALASFLPSCDTNTYACVASLSQIFDLHDITGAIASVGQFLSMLCVLILVRNKISDKLFKASVLLLIVWSISGLTFVILSTGSLRWALFMQHLFLVLSSLGLIAIPWALTRSKFVANY